MGDGSGDGAVAWAAWRSSTTAEFAAGEIAARKMAASEMAGRRWAAWRSSRTSEIDGEMAASGMAG